MRDRATGKQIRERKKETRNIVNDVSQLPARCRRCWRAGMVGVVNRQHHGQPGNSTYNKVNRARVIRQRLARCRGRRVFNSNAQNARVKVGGASTVDRDASHDWGTLPPGQGLRDRTALRRRRPAPLVTSAEVLHTWSAGRGRYPPEWSLPPVRRGMSDGQCPGWARPHKGADDQRPRAQAVQTIHPWSTTDL